MTNGEPEIPPGVPPEMPPAELPPELPPGNPPEVPEPPAETPPEPPPEIPPPTEQAADVLEFSHAPPRQPGRCLRTRLISSTGRVHGCQTTGCRNTHPSL